MKKKLVFTITYSIEFEDLSAGDAFANIEEAMELLRGNGAATIADVAVVNSTPQKAGK